METSDKTFLGSDRYLHHTFKSSNNIAYVKYDSLLLSLLVIFHNGSEYEYSGVDLDTYNELLLAPSAGSYFNTVIRKFKYERLK
jgi:hypothetical protein